MMFELDTVGHYTSFAGLVSVNARQLSAYHPLLGVKEDETPKTTLRSCSSGDGTQLFRLRWRHTDARIQAISAEKLNDLDTYGRVA